MKYNGIELVEMTPEDWDGKSREMLVWCNSGICHIKNVIGYNPRRCAWVVDDKVLVYWPHCAEIPKEDLVESLKELLEMTPFEDALFTRIKNLKKKLLT